MKPLYETRTESNSIDGLVDKLCSAEWYDIMAHRNNPDKPMPSVGSIKEIIELLRTILFPGYFGPSEISPESMRYYVGATLDRLRTRIAEQIRWGLCFDCTRAHRAGCPECEEEADIIADEFLSRLPRIKRMLATDVRAAYEGDPAAQSPSEAIFCYPSLRALTYYRIAHELYSLKTKLIPRIIAELAHSETGIDIHPGAQIGESLFMDHGTGIVIGETCIIERNVRIYQGVTLGAKSFPLDDKGNPIKGIARHPIVEEDVIIYAEATILGRIRIGKGSVIGGNVWITGDVPPYSKVHQQGRTSLDIFDGGSGI